MSGYLEVKYPLKSNLGLNPFKSWKRQWCILRPSPTSSGGSLAVYCSEAGAAVGCVELPAGSVVRRAKSRSKLYAFGVYGVDDRKPRVLLAAPTLHDAQSWMDKIRTLLSGDKLLGTEAVSASYPVSECSGQLGGRAGASVTVCGRGLLLAGRAAPQLLRWRHLADVALTSHLHHHTCIITIDSTCPSGGGQLHIRGPAAPELASRVRNALATNNDSSPISPTLPHSTTFPHSPTSPHSPMSSTLPHSSTLPSSPTLPPSPVVEAPARSLSRSDGDLAMSSSSEAEEIRRSSWYSGPSEVSLDDIDLIMSKDAARIPSGQLSRCARAPDLAPRPPQPPRLAQLAAHHSISDRRSLASVASGIYEEIPDLPEPARESISAPNHTTDIEAVYCAMSRDVIDGPRVALSLPTGGIDEPTYESVSECVYATMRRTGKRFPPPPLPPRLPFGAMKAGEWGANGPAVTRAGSLGALPRACSLSSGSSVASAATLPSKPGPFSVFRKRLKSDSRLGGSPKSDTAKENKDIEPKKKRFDFTPTRDIFKSFKMGRKMRNLKIAGLAKGEAKSCEFLDETEHVTADRCSKSAERLDDEFDEFDGDLSIEFNDDAVAALALPQEIVQLILRARRSPPPPPEEHYLPMSRPPPPLEQHYITMAPRAPPLV